MYRINGLCILGVCFLLQLISLSGCATHGSVAPDAHPEKYRRVYLLKSKTDPREVDRRVSERLKKAGFDVTEIPYDDTAKNGRAEAVKKARELAATNDEQPAVLCSVNYLGFYTQTEIENGRRYYFENLEIPFYDIKSADLVFRAVKYNYDYWMPEELELNRQFIKISDAFFPGQPNPFRVKQ